EVDSISLIQRDGASRIGDTTIWVCRVVEVLQHATICEVLIRHTHLVWIVWTNWQATEAVMAILVGNGSVDDVAITVQEFDDNSFDARFALVMDAVAILVKPDCVADHAQVGWFTRLQDLA